MTEGDSKFEQLFDDIFEVLQSNDIGNEILDKEPSDYNLQPELMEFLQDTKGENNTVREKFGVDKYGLDIHLFYQDVKLATVGLLIQHPIGSEKYAKINNFFRFIIEIIFRDGERFGLFPVHSNSDPQFENSFENEATDGFHKIFADAKEWYGEAYFIMGQNGPLFSSMTGKAPIDPRETETHGQFNTTKIIPQLENDTTRTYQMGYVSPALSRIPHPALPPTELLSFFKHPIDASLTTSKWLSFDGYSSFAPSKDNAGAILDPITAGSVWYEKLGQRKLVSEEDVKEAAQERIKELESKLGENAEDDDKDVEMADAEPNDKKPNDDNSGPNDKGNDDLVDNKQDKTPPPDKGKDEDLEPSELEAEEIDLESILEWTPASFLDEDEIDARESGTEQELVSNLLLQLQHMQRVRLANNNGTELTIPLRERRLAIKIQNILSRLIHEETPKSLDMSLSSHLPMLQMNYQGVLPGAPDPKPLQAGGRLQGLNSRSTPSRSRSRR